ncbi:uncharacterized protein E0L32_010747 [Thyridium curvatum]|uniref:Folliculin-interacting protein N-terminal domain-containing protein n=1 Tax=Thyridium curvatum TaxID=1093900 RepID=A0A507ADW2_9PEZI|nr:uncharacterized protein E0L32_010747 [Thyridium curvatum]TPX07325.1 hypothetical protein E0L32_010747 [Thyridium curvatum]
MLGKLFNLTSTAPVAATPVTPAGPSKPISSLESVQEDVHTRNLLFPDAQALFQHRNDQVFPLSAPSTHPAASSADAFDYEGDIELDTRDVRVLIMQDALSSTPATVLYDSQPPPPVPTSPATERSSTTGLAHVNLSESRRLPTSPRKPSMGHSARPVIIQPGSPQRHGVFDRRPSIQSRAQPRAESESQRAHREYTEELAGFSSCIFGNSELLAYKGTSTKMHLVPSDRGNDFASPLPGDGRGSFGRASMRSSKLSQSFSSEAVSPNPATGSPSATSRAGDRRKVLITRLFPVSLPSDDDDMVTPHSRFSDDSSGYPFPQYGEDTKGKKKKPQPKQKRTPMYAVALVISLPQGYSQPSSAAPSKPSFRGQGSYTEQDSFPSSFGSARRSGWTMVGMDSLDASYTSDIEDRIDAITQHWDIIMRTLTHMQSAVAAILYSMLKHADIASPDPFPASISSHISRTPSFSGRRRSEDGGSTKPPKSNAKLISLFPNCLLDNEQIKAEVEVARSRVVNGLRATRVVTGQNRWSIWREEARWVARWAAEKEQAPFFYNLLTGFLATHTDWLQALSPAWYRRRHLQQQKAKGDEDTSLPARTIIVSQDKMAARRLIFLLSAFLPANQQLPTMRMHRPSTSTSWGAGFSQSPPSFVVPILKEESLRRKINRRSGLRRASHSRSASMQGPNPRTSGVPVHLAHLAMERGHERRASDASSIRTTNLPITGGDYASRKSSTATAATIAPEPTIPHFATLQRAETTGSHMRPGSASSAAADDLKRTLRRGDSVGHASMGSTDSRQSSRWGSVISGLWNGRRRLSTDITAQTRDSLDSRDSTTSSPTKSHRKRASLTQMVKEAQSIDPADKIKSRDTSPRTSRDLVQTSGLGNESSDARQSRALEQFQRTPDPSGAFESPVKTSINAEDGVIDVDVPFPEYITSFETAVSSPSSSGYLSTPGLGNGLEAFEQSCRVAIDGDVPLNVAGWLQNYHPDFVLQGIPPPSGDLFEHIRDSLRAEPSPPLSSYSMSVESQHERWVEVSNVIVADTTNFTITRIRYRRLIRPVIPNDRRTPSLAGSLTRYGSLQPTPLFSPPDMQLEEEFIEEPVACLDDVLIEAVEKVIAHSSDASKVSSTCSSRSASIRRDRSNSTSTGSDEPQGLPRYLGVTSAPHEVPRAECKTVVLSALEEIVREVIEKREREGREGDEHKKVQEKEGSLRRAVRTWMENVEMGE